MEKTPPHARHVYILLRLKSQAREMPGEVEDGSIDDYVAHGGYEAITKIIINTLPKQSQNSLPTSSQPSS